MPTPRPISKAELQAVLDAALSAQSKDLHAALSAQGKELRADFHAALSAQSKDFHAALSAQSKELRADFHAALSAQSKELRADFHAALSAQGKELRADFHAALSAQGSGLRAEMSDLREELKEFTRQIETNLLTEFHRYAKGQLVRLHKLETSDADIVLQLAVVEERLLALEAQRPPTPFPPPQPR